MKSFIVLAVFVALVVAEDAYYKTPDDQLNIDEIVSDPAKLKTFIDCFLDKQPCDAIAQSYKDNTNDAIKTVCAKCTSRQKSIFRSFIVATKKMYPNELEAFRAKYDPSGKNFEALQKAL